MLHVDLLGQFPCILESCSDNAIEPMRKSGDLPAISEESKMPKTRDARLALCMLERYED